MVPTKRGSSLPAARGSKVQVTWLKASRNSSGRLSVTRHTVKTYLPAITPFLVPKKGSEGQTIHLGRKRQAVREELVHNAAPGILRDSHSPPCVEVGHVPQQPGPIPLICRYWFLFLGLRLVSFFNATHIYIRHQIVLPKGRSFYDQRRSDRHTHTHTHTHIFSKTHFKLCERCRIKNHKKNRSLIFFTIVVLLSFTLNAARK